MTVCAPARPAGSPAARGPLHRLAASAASPLSRAGLADQHDVDAIAPFGEQSCRYEPVAAVVAGSRYHNDPAPGTRLCKHGVGDGSAGPLHKLDAGHTAGDGEPVCLRHFGIAEKFDHNALKVAAVDTITPLVTPAAWRNNKQPA